MRTLVVMRHARAESSAPSDHERELTDRGHAAASEAGEWLAEQVAAPDLALVSAAARTEQTWEALAIGAGWDVHLAEFDDAIYTGSTDAVLDLIRQVDEGVGTLVVIGHNPTVSSLVQLIDDGRGDEDAGNEIAVGYPPAAVAVYTCDGRWDELEESSATLKAFHVGVH